MKLLGVTEYKDGEPVATGKLERCRLCLLPDFSFLTGNNDTPYPQYHGVPDRGKYFIYGEGKMYPTVSLGNELRERMGMGSRTSSTPWVKVNATRKPSQA